MEKGIARILPIVLTLLASFAYGDQWHKTYSVPGRSEINVDTNDGDVRVSASDRKDIDALVIVNGRKIGQGGVIVNDHQEGTRVSLTIRVPNNWGIHFGSVHRSVQVELQVPRESNLSLHSGDGNLRVLDVRGSAQLETGDGDIECHGTEGAIRGHTGDGNIYIDGVYSALDLHTGDGNIQAQVRTGSKMDSRWSLRTGDGNIELRVPDNFPAEVDAQSGDGHITLDFPVMVKGSVKESSIHGTMNGGGQTLELRSGDGNISLLKG